MRIELLKEMDGVMSIDSQNKEMVVTLQALGAISEMTSLLQGWTIRIVPPKGIRIKV